MTLCSRPSELIVLPWEEPGHEVHGCDGHAHTEERAGENTLGTAFAKRNSEASKNDCHERKAACDRAGERLHEDVDRVVPGTTGLGECRRSEKERGREDRER